MRGTTRHSVYERVCTAPHVSRPCAGGSVAHSGPCREKRNACVPVSATHMSHSAVHLRTTGANIKELIRDGYENFWPVTDSVALPDVARAHSRCCTHAHHIHIRYKMGQVGTHAASAVRSCNIWECDRIRYNQKFSHPSRINSLIIGPVVRRCTTECDICVALTGRQALRFPLHGPE